MVTAALAMSCPGCGHHCQDCPACPSKLATGAKAVPGVESARSVDYGSSGMTPAVSYRPARTRLAVIEAAVERAPPSGCCSDLLATRTRQPT